MDKPLLGADFQQARNGGPRKWRIGAIRARGELENPARFCPNDHDLLNMLQAGYNSNRIMTGQTLAWARGGRLRHSCEQL
jgi:hypothetical protein